MLLGISPPPFAIYYATQEQAKVYADRAEAIENEMGSKLSKAKASLEESNTRLVGRTANSAKVGPRQREELRRLFSLVLSVPLL